MDYTAEELEGAKAELRDHIRLRTFAAGKLFGEEWVGRAPDDAELRALYAEQLAGWRLSKELEGEADALLSDDPDNPWGSYIRALGHLAAYETDLALEPGRRAWEALPRPEFAAAYARAMRTDDFDAALGFLGTLDPEIGGSPEVLAARAELENLARYEREDPTWADSSLATYAELRERWPDHVDGYLRAAEALFRANRPEEALPLIEQAVALAPSSVDVRQWHWWILFESDALPTDERRPAVEASIAEFRDAAPESLRSLSVMASMYRDLEDDDRAEELEAMVVEREPESRHALLVYVGRQRAAEEERRRILEEHGQESPEYQAQLAVVRDAVHEFLDRPHYNDRYTGGAYIDLFNALRQMDPLPAEELADAVRGLAANARGTPPWITYLQAPRAMAEHTPYALEAAEIAREGFRALIDYYQETRRFFDTEGEFDQAIRAALSEGYDAMGWALAKGGRSEDARHTLERALVLWGENPSALYHMGQLYEQRAAEAAERQDEEEASRWLDQAEDSYIAGFGASRRENPNEGALEALYESRNGSREGIEEYLATLDERDRIRRRERILESRVEAAGTYEPFTLARLDGEMVDSSELEGKIAVLHFWGTWCGPCVVEMPEYQKFDERYRNDAEVAVLSISNDRTNDVIEEYLAKNNFDFTVLVDDDYVTRAGVSAWPTTWFVDRDGYIQFVKIGTALKLDEEFSWRVEALRETDGTR